MILHTEHVNGFQNHQCLIQHWDEPQVYYQLLHFLAFQSLRHQGSLENVTTSYYAVNGRHIVYIYIYIYIYTYIYTYKYIYIYI